jgi:UDP-N-acetylglucosamine 2-epimerase (non-hydrolysing)
LSLCIKAIFFELFSGDPFMKSGKIKIAVIFGTRPECIKLAPVIRAIDSCPEMESLVVSSSQHSDLLTPFLKSFDVHVDHDLKVMRAGQSPNEVLSRVLTPLEKLLCEERPRIVLVQGDTTTALAGAITAFHSEIPVGHVEAGLRTGDIRAPFPEEMNRRLISQLSSYHFAATEQNVKNLERENVLPSAIWLTGNPIVDALNWIRDNRSPSDAVTEIISRHSGKKIIVLTTHRRESFGVAMKDNFRALVEFVNSNMDHVVLFPIHPNPNVRDAAAEVLMDARGIETLDPLDYTDFVHLLSAAWLIVSDSGGIQEEAPSLGKRLIVLRRNTERPEVVEAGVGKLIGDNPRLLKATLQNAANDQAWSDAVEAKQALYGSGNAAEQIVRALGSIFGDN